MNFRGTRREDPEINLIPMIDVLLVILIFLMVTTTYSQVRRAADQPAVGGRREADRPPERDQHHRERRGPVHDRPQAGVVHDVAAFGEAMRAAAGGLKDPIVVINADAAANHQSVIHVMEAARLAGLSHVSFATQTQTK